MDPFGTLCEKRYIIKDRGYLPVLNCFNLSLKILGLEKNIYENLPIHFCNCANYTIRKLNNLTQGYNGLGNDLWENGVNLRTEASF